MANPKRKVKPSAIKRYRVTLEKTVMLRLHTTMEVQVRKPITDSQRITDIHHAARLKLDAERAAGTEREWSTSFIDGNHEFSIDWGSIEEIEPHIENTTAKTDV